MMSHLARSVQRAGVFLLILSFVILGLGIWGQMQKSRLDLDRADAMIAEGPAGFDSVPVPFILQPFEANLIPGFVAGDRGTVFGVFARIGGALGVLGIILLSIRTVRIPVSGAGQDQTENQVEDEEVERPTMAQMQATPTAEWQRRLAVKMEARTGSPSRSSAATMPSKPGTSLALIVAVILGFGALVLGATTFLMSAEPMATPDVAAMLDRAIMAAKADLSGDKLLLLGALKVVAVLVGCLVLLRLFLLWRRSALSEKIAAH